MRLTQKVQWEWWLATLIMYILVVELGISLTYHRFLTHRSFELNRFWEVLFTIITGVTGTGSSYGWVTVHRTHHMFPDTDKDPHSPHFIKKRDLLLGNYNIQSNKWVAKDLLRDRFHMKFHNYYLLWMGMWVAILFAIGFAPFVHIWAAPFVLNKTQAFLSVWLSHEYGYRNYETPDKSRQNWFVSLIVFGEGWHNNHHYNPNNWSFSLKWWELDLGGILVRLFKSKA